MKKSYAKPLIEIESYELNASIASNCGNKVTLGPGAADKIVCSEFDDSFEVFSFIPGLGLQAVGGKPFYEDGTAECTCYYSSGDGRFFTS